MSTVVSLGVHILDILGRYVSRIPEGQNIELIDEIRVTAAGTAAGAAVDMAKLGLTVKAMGAVGDDRIGDVLLGLMQGYGVDTAHIVRKGGVQTSCTILPIRRDGSRPALHVIGTNGRLEFDDVDLDAIAAADYLHFGGTYLLPGLDGEPTRRILRFAKEHGVTTTLDMLAIDRPDLLPLIEPCLPYIDYFMPGLGEAQMVCGLEDRLEVERFFLERGVGSTVLKMGSQGSSVARLAGGLVEETRIPAFEAPVADSTGCGDAYCAGFICGLTMRWEPVEAARLGAACGAKVITGLGSDAGIVDLADTLAFMQRAPVLPID